MHGLAAGRLPGGDDRGNVQVAVAGRGWADAHRAIGESRVQRAGVRCRVDRHRLHSQLVQRPDDTDRDLAAVRNQNTREHRVRERLPDDP